MICVKNVVHVFNMPVDLKLRVALPDRQGAQIRQRDPHLYKLFRPKKHRELIAWNKVWIIEVLCRIEHIVCGEEYPASRGVAAINHGNNYFGICGPYQFWRDGFRLHVYARDEHKGFLSLCERFFCDPVGLRGSPGSFTGGIVLEVGSNSQGDRSEGNNNGETDFDSSPPVYHLNWLLLVGALFVVALGFGYNGLWSFGDGDFFRGGLAMVIGVIFMVIAVLVLFLRVSPD
jgi:hypothetical protein